MGVFHYINYVGHAIQEYHAFLAFQHTTFFVRQYRVVPLQVVPDHILGSHYGLVCPLSMHLHLVLVCPVQLIVGHPIKEFDLV